jgi:AcrR family transcriptional regulator
MANRAQREPSGLLESVAEKDGLKLTNLQAKLVDAAAECVREHGIHAVRARDIASIRSA